MKGWRVLAGNALVMIYSLVEVFSETTVLAEEQTAITAGVLALGNFLMRFITTTPVGGDPAA